MTSRFRLSSICISKGREGPQILRVQQSVSTSKDEQFTKQMVRTFKKRYFYTAIIRGTVTHVINIQFNVFVIIYIKICTYVMPLPMCNYCYFFMIKLFRILLCIDY